MEANLLNRGRHQSVSQDTTQGDAMADGFNWTCPSCGSHTTITSPNCCSVTLDVIASNTPKDKGIIVRGVLIECPNKQCQAQSFKVIVNRASRQIGTYSPLRENASAPVGIGSFTFLPTTASPLSQYVPASILEDYNEAYLISKLSPKASATLARRALQGMVRDYFQISGLRTLHAELIAIEDKCDPDLYAAIMAVKSIGNIGAHPEQDIGLIVGVEPGEPETLLDLIHLLDREWYVARAERKSRIAKVQALSASKAPVSVGVIGGLGLAQAAKQHPLKDIQS